MALRTVTRIVLAALALCALAPTVAQAASQIVTIQDLAFSPPTVTINVGETVTWHNADAATHTATSDTPGGFDTSFLPPGGSSRAISFTVAGTFAYHCTIHTTMHGTVVVLGATPTPAPPTPLPSTPRPTVPPTAPPTAAPTAPPAPSPSPSPAPSASPSQSPPPSPSPSPTPSAPGTPIAVPTALVLASPSPAPTAGPDIGGPGPLIAAGGLALAAALAGVALYLYRRR